MDEEKGKDEFAKVERKLRKLEKQEKWANRKLFQKKDIRYLGPLSYREFKILGWLCLSCTAVVMMMNLAIRFFISVSPCFRSRGGGAGVLALHIPDASRSRPSGLKSRDV